MRTGREEGRIEIGKLEEEERRGEKKRRSKDKIINGEGKRLVNCLGEKGWSIFNGDMKGDEEGEWAFAGGKGNIVINYVIGDEECREMVENFKIGGKVDSDHQPVEVEIKGELVKRNKGRRKEKNRVGKGRWNEEGRKVFREKVRRIERKNVKIKEEWERVEERIREALRETEDEIGIESGKERGWWDEE